MVPHHSIYLIDDQLLEVDWGGDPGEELELFCEIPSQHIALADLSQHAVYGSAP
jgi:hypothetical protein